MVDEEKIQQLADIIYSQCGVQIRNDETYTIATKLVELGYEKKSETALTVLTAMCEPMEVWTETDDPEQSRQRKIGGLLFVEKSNERIQEIAKSYGIEINK